MSDGDIVHANLKAKFRASYREVCDDGYEPQEAAHNLADPLKKTIQEQGDSAREFIHSICGIFSQGMPNRPFEVIREEARKFSGDRRGIELAQQAATRLLARKADLTNEQVLLEEYITITCDAEFFDRIPLAVEHYNSISPDELEERLTEVRGYMGVEIEAFARQLLKGKTLKDLRRRPLTSTSIALRETFF